MKVWGLPRNPVADLERPRDGVSDDLDAFSPEEVWALVRAARSEQDAAPFLAAAFTGVDVDLPEALVASVVAQTADRLARPAEQDQRAERACARYSDRSASATERRAAARAGT